MHVGSDSPSSSATLRRRLPKRQRQRQQRQTALAPTPCLVAGRSLPLGQDPTEPPARATDPHRNSYNHRVPKPRCVPEICNQDNQHCHDKRATMINNDDDNENDDDKHITSSSSALHAATGPSGRPRSTPVRERPGLSHPHSVDAAVGSPLSQVSGVLSASPNKTEFGDLGVEHSSPRPVKASAGVRNVRNDAPAPAGNSREPHDESGRLLPEPTNPIYDSTENEGTGTQTKTCGREPGPVPLPQEDKLNSGQFSEVSSRQFSD